MKRAVAVVSPAWRARVRRALRRWLPPAVADGLAALRGDAIRFAGPMAGWEAAEAASAGYDAENVLQRVAWASRQVRDGAAPYERDSVLFERIEHSFALVAALLRAALDKRGRLCVIDFGGSLGSSYRECRPFLGPAVAPLSWVVVEQAAFVRLGRDEFQTEELTFETSFADALGRHRPDVVLLSGVLQYMRDPHRLLDEAIGAAPRFIVVDRTIVTERPADAVYVQGVPRRIYEGSYPVWALSRAALLRKFEGRYALVSEHPSLPFPALCRIGAEFKGFVFEAKAAP